MRKLKILESYLYFDKHTRNIPLCCHIFFEFVNTKLRNTIPEYQQANIHDSKNGIILCPKCIIKQMKEHT